MNLAIIGAGPLGRRLASRSAKAGIAVALEDIMPSNLRHAAQLLREQLNPETMPLVSFTRTVEDAVREAELVIDCVPDELESKLEIFSLLDRMAPPRTVFATPTLTLSIADLASCTYRLGQCVGLALSATSLDTPESSVDNPRPPEAIAIRITSQTTPATSKLISEFLKLIGYQPRLELDAAEKLLR